MLLPMLGLTDEVHEGQLCPARYCLTLHPKGWLHASLEDALQRRVIESHVVREEAISLPELHGKFDEGSGLGHDGEVKTHVVFPVVMGKIGEGGVEHVEGTSHEGCAINGEP